MRPAPGPIPAELPPAALACRLIQGELDRPRSRLVGTNLSSLVHDFSDGTPAWLTGSTVWLHALYGMDPPPDGDLDVVFATQTACDRFVRGSMAVLNVGARERYRLARSKKGGQRIVHPDGQQVIDAWTIGNLDTISEHLLGYPKDHQRCAYLISRTPSAGCLFRLTGAVKARVEREFVQKRGSSMFTEISRSIDSNYSGAADDPPPEIVTTPQEQPPGIYSSNTRSLLALLRKSQDGPPTIAAPIPKAGG